MANTQPLSSDQILSFLSGYKNAIALYTTEDIIIQYANNAMLNFWDRDNSIVGLSLDAALPEIKAQPFMDMLRAVYHTGVDDVGEAIRADLVVDKTLQTFYFDYAYRAIKNDSGQTIAIIHTAEDVTEKVSGREAIQRAKETGEALVREQVLNEELAAANEELNATNEQLNNIQNSLNLLNIELERRVSARTRELAASEKKLDQIISQIPAPIVVLQGPNQVISTTNDALLSFWEKTKDEVYGKPMLEIFPELKTQPFPAQWKHVLTTGETIANRERPVTFNRSYGKRLYYVDYYYQPLTDIDGNRNAVLATVIDVTDQVQARQALQHAEAKLMQAIDSSELGTWYIDTTTMQLVASPRLKELFGFLHSEDMTFQDAISQIADDYRETVSRTIESAIASGENYEMEYPIKGRKDSQLRWVRATGKVYPSDGGYPSNFSGTVMDITARKLEEQRKDDFISIASHELKTPTTTLKATLQLMDRMKENPNPKVFGNMVTQANRSVTKLSTLIEDLLNTSRATDGQLHLNKTHFSIAEMLAVSCNHVRMAGKHRLALQGDKTLKVYADEHQVDQVVVNLVNNAVKYAPESEEIFLIVEKGGNQAKISVKDNGPGIPSEKLPHLFNRYYQADHEGGQYSGLGLGLYISAEIIKKHGGKMGVVSELGKGSTFWFTLPLS